MCFKYKQCKELIFSQGFEFGCTCLGSFEVVNLRSVFDRFQVGFSQMDMLLDELVVNILLFCNVTTLCRVRLSCQRLKRLVTYDIVWEKHLKALPTIEGGQDWTHKLVEQLEVEGGKTMMLYQKKNVEFLVCVAYSSFLTEHNIF